MSGYLATTVLRAGPILEAVTGRFRNLENTDVIVGKETTLELLRETPEGGLEAVWEQNVFGTLKGIKTFPWNPDLRLSQGNEVRSNFGRG